MENDAMQLLGYAYLQNARPGKAALILGALDAVVPGQREVLRGLAVAQLRAGQPQEALETLDRIQLAGGVDAAFHLARARALLLCGREPEAAAAMGACLKLRAAARQEGAAA